MEEENTLDVLHVTEACGGGVRRHLRLIVPELIERGFKCGVIGFGQRVEEEFLDDLEYYRSIGCKTLFHPFNHGLAFGILGFTRRIRQIVNDWNPHVIHAHATVAGLVCRRAFKDSPIPKIVYSPHAFALHPSLPLWQRIATRHIEKKWEHRTDAYAFVGRSEINDANELHLSPEKFHLIENGLPRTFADRLYSREDARHALSIPQDSIVAVVPCRLVRQKGLDKLLEAISLLGDDDRKLTFMFCGDGPEKRHLDQLAQHLGIRDRISFPGSIERLAYLLPAFDLAILPSLYEGLSYVLLECIAAGVPLVVSDILANVPRPELRDIVQTFTLGNTDELASCLRKCIREPKWATRRALYGSEFMKSNFRLTSQIEKICMLYQTV